MLCVLGGNASPDAAAFKKVLAPGVEADDAALTKVISELDGKSINDLDEAGQKKLASVPSGGSGGSGDAPTAKAGPAAKAAAPPEEEEEEEEEADMGFSLFD